MNSLKIKITCNLAACARHCSIANPSAALGEIGTLRIIEVTEIPDDTPNWEVLKRWNETSDISWLYNDLKYPRHTYRFREIGNGAILRGKRGE